MDNCVNGLGYFSDTVRGVLIDTSTGKELGSNVHYYQGWKNNKYCDTSINQFHQHPLDHFEGLDITIKSVVKGVNVNSKKIKGICIDATVNYLFQ